MRLRANGVNRIESFPSILQHEVIRRDNGNITSRQTLLGQLIGFIGIYDGTAKPFRWADAIDPWRLNGRALTSGAKAPEWSMRLVRGVAQHEPLRSGPCVGGEIGWRCPYPMREPGRRTARGSDCGSLVRLNLPGQEVSDVRPTQKPLY
jgi:hypothetical protein